MWKPTILYVEDDELTRWAMTAVLRNMAGDLFTASNGREGLDLFLKHRPDIVVTDIEMPEMNGKEMIEHISRLAPKAPIIVITAYTDEEHRTEKAWATIGKPIDTGILKEAIANLSQLIDNLKNGVVD